MIAQLDREYVRARPSKTITRLMSFALFEGRPLTARGRWINPLVLGMHRLISNLDFQAEIDRPIFVIGRGRSGTTIVGKLLSLHPHIGFLNEPIAMWYTAAPMTDVTGAFGGSQPRIRLAREDASPDIEKKLKRLYQTYLRATLSRRLLDKSPGSTYRVDFIRAMFPDARFLVMMRNGWAAVRSTIEWSLQHQKQTKQGLEDWWGIDGSKWRVTVKEIAEWEPDLAPAMGDIAATASPYDRAAVEWIASTRESLRVMRENPSRMLLIRYEDLLANPTAMLERTLEFCDLPPDRRVMDYARTALRTGRSSTPFKLHPTIQPAWEQAIEEAGYSPASAAQLD